MPVTQRLFQLRPAAAAALAWAFAVPAPAQPTSASAADSGWVRVWNGTDFTGFYLFMKGNAPQVKHAQDAARALGVRLQLLGAQDPGEIDSAFAVMTGEQAVIVLVDAMLQGNRARITDLAARHRLPAVYGLSEYAEVGGLLAYGPNRLDMFRHASVYVDKILKGANPGDLPVEQPTKFELVINLKTAKTLGLTIPPALLVRADQVIE